MTEEVRRVCDLRGFDPFYLANEGKLIAFVLQEKAKRVFDVMKADPLGRESVIIGRVVDENPGKVLLKTRIGGHSFLEPLSGEQFARVFWITFLFLFLLNKPGQLLVSSKKI